MKLTLTLFATLLTILHGSSQLSFGLKGGYVKAWERYGDIGLPEDARIHVNGLQVSGVVDLPVSELVSFSLEPGYVRRGAACYPGWVSQFRDTKFRFNYIELPVMLGIHHTFPGSHFGIIGKAGYGASYMISATQETIFTDIVDSSSEKVEFNEEDWINRWDHGMYGGIGVSYSIAGNRLIAEAMHYHGRTDVDKNNVTGNRSLQFTVGYMVSL